MKIIFLDRSLEPMFKNGPEMAALFVPNIIGSIITSESSKSIANSQISAQESQNQLNRDWQTLEAEKARSYNTNERIASQEYNKQMLDYVNLYSSPKSQVQRLQQAGINPQVAMSSNVQNVSGSSQPSTPQSSPMPSQVSGLSPVPQQPLDLQIPQMLNSVGSLIKNVADAKGKSVETDRMISTFNDYIQQMHIDTQIKELSKDTLSIDNFIKNEVKDAAVLKAWDEAKKANFDALISSNEVSMYDLNKRILESQDNLNKALASYHGANAELVRLDVGSYNRRVNSLINMQGAQANEALANVEVLKQEKRIREISANLREKSQVDELNSIVSQLRSKDAISKQQEAEAVKELAKINKIISSYNNSDSKLKVDAVLDNFFKIIGLNVSASVHN